MENSNTIEQKNSLFFKEIDIEFLIHELKTPVAVTKTSLETLLKKKEKFDINEKQEKIIKRAVRNSKKAIDMIYLLLEVGRAETETFNYIKFNPFDALYEILLESLEATDYSAFYNLVKFNTKLEVIKSLSEYGINFDIKPNIQNINIVQDKIKFEHIIGNIIRNALYYKKSRVCLFMEIENQKISIKIEDDGCGINSKNYNAIFQRYKQPEKKNLTRASAGHGLGLSGALIIARKLGGNITVASNKKKGAIFEIILPI